jgi:RNA polymerase sigma-70 factor (ECF subfamily)
MDQQAPAASDDALLARLGEGSEAAWTEFYRRYQARVYRFALQMTGSKEMAEEAVQETFLALMDRATRFDPSRGEVASYVFGIARHKVLGLLGRERNYLPLEPGFDAPSTECTESGLVLQEETERVRQAVLALPSGYREAVVLCDLQQMDYVQAAGIVGCALGTIRSRLHRGRQLLAEKLAALAERRGCRS